MIRPAQYNKEKNLTGLKLPLLSAMAIEDITDEVLIRLGADSLI